MRNTRLFISTALLCLAAPALGQTVTTYTDRTSFNAAAGPVSGQDFNGFATDATFQNVPLKVGDFTIVGTGTAQLNRNFVDVSPFLFSTHGTGDGSPFADILVAAAGGADVTLSFLSPILAWGADFGDLSQGNVQRTSINFGGMTLVPTSTSQTAVRFFGFVSSTPFSSLTFSSTGTNDGFGIDNVSYAFANAAPMPGVPEPATWAMLLAGFGAIGFAMRRKRGAGPGRRVFRREGASRRMPAVG